MEDHPRNPAVQRFWFRLGAGLVILAMLTQVAAAIYFARHGEDYFPAAGFCLITSIMIACSARRTYKHWRR